MFVDGCRADEQLRAAIQARSAEYRATKRRSEDPSEGSRPHPLVPRSDPAASDPLPDLLVQAGHGKEDGWTNGRQGRSHPSEVLQERDLDGRGQVVRAVGAEDALDHMAHRQEREVPIRPRPDAPGDERGQRLGHPPELPVGERDAFRRSRRTRRVPDRREIVRTDRRERWDLGVAIRQAGLEEGSPRDHLAVDRGIGAAERDDRQPRRELVETFHHGRGSHEQESPNGSGAARRRGLREASSRTAER